MNELIPVAPRQIGGVTMLTSEGRDLHTHLDVGKDFSTWIKDRIEQYGFVEGAGFSTYLLPNFGEKGQGRPTKEYIISVGMAKELAMVERTPKGKEARLYYIECERRVLIGDAAALQAPVQTNPARVSRSPASDRVKALALVTREIARIPGVRPEAAATAFLAIVERDTGLPVSDLRHALPSTPAEAAFQLNPTHLAQRLKIEGLKAGHVNLALIALGLQEEGERDYVVTAKGAEFGEMRHYTSPRNGHQGYQSVWSVAVVPLLAAYFAEHPEAAKPLPRAPRKTAQKKTSTGAASPQAALL